MRKVFIVPLLLLGGCSSFDRDFDGWVPRTSADGYSDLLGCWEGTWQSDENGHTGTLRCIFTRGNSGYDARYYATYAWLCLPLGFEYVIPTTAVSVGAPHARGGAWTLRGSAELGCFIAGGLYEYEARVENGEYVATYRSDFDHGVFRLKRVK